MKNSIINKTEDLFVGIDFGTFNIAVMANNGKKESIKSFVGKPKDFVSAQTLKKPFLFGEDALKKKRSLEIYRPLQYGVLKQKSEKGDQFIKALISHLIGLVKSYENQNIFAVVGVPAECHKKNRDAIIEALSGHVHSSLVVSEPFAVAYSLGVLNDAMVIDIGAGTTDFCITQGAIPKDEDQRTIYFAGDHADQHLDKLLKLKFPGRFFDLDMVRSFKEQNSFVGSKSVEVEVDISVKGVKTSFDITDEMRQSCEKIIDPVVDTITDMLNSSETGYRNKILNNIILSGGGSRIKGLCDYMKTALLKDFGPTQINIIDDSIFAGAQGALKLALDIPLETWLADPIV